jgi:hypothetical protein
MLRAPFRYFDRSVHAVMGGDVILLTHTRGLDWSKCQVLDRRPPCERTDGQTP